MTYDANGNTLSDGMNTYAWDARNRLASADNNGAVFSYDPLGRRVAKTMMTTTTSFLYDGANPVQESDTLPTANLLTGGTDERFTRTTATETDNFLTDALGSTVALTGATGASQVQYSYSPYGSQSITGSTSNSYTYTGRETDGLGINYYRATYRYAGYRYDNETGLYYVNARYYNPNLGRFLQTDPIGLRGGRNLYAYVGNDPTNFIDPFGLCSESASVTTRVIDGIEGTANLSLATLKTVGLGAADTALGALGPESGGLSIVAAAALTTYGVTSIGGQAVSGAGQLYTAFTGNSSTGENLTQAGDILAGPASGISTLASTGNAAQAQQNANVESMITAGTGLVNSKTVSGAIQSVVDTALSVVSVVQNFANSYVNNFQAAFLPSARWW